MKNALDKQVGMLGGMFLWLVANLKQGGIYFIKQALPPNKSAGSVTCFVLMSFVFEIKSELIQTDFFSKIVLLFLQIKGDT